VSDSQYLVKGIGEWLPSWKARGWRRKGGPIENLELWQELDGELARHEVRARWVRGHAGHPRNEYANDLAVRAAKEQTKSGGLVPSEFERWLDDQRAKGRYLDYQEFLPPGE
jgi:ribonuclease HI